MKLSWNNVKYNYNIFLYGIMAKTRRKPNAFIKKVVAYYKAHKKEGIKYSDAIKKVANSYKKGGGPQSDASVVESENKIPASVVESENKIPAPASVAQNTRGVETIIPAPVAQNQQGGKRRRKSGKKAKKGSRRTRRR
jgi:hypothetical protein